MASSLPSSSPAPQGPISRSAAAAGTRLLHFQVRRPYVVLLIIAVITAVSALLAMRLTMRTGFEALLPESRKSVKELDRVAALTAGVSTIFIVLEGDDTPGLRKAADALVPALKEIGPPWVGAVEDGVHDAVTFMGPRAGLFADSAVLKKLLADVDARYEYEVAKATGADLGFDDDVPAEINAESIKKQLGLKDEDTRRFPDGYYQSQDGKTLVVAIRAGVLGSDFDKAKEALRRVREVIERVNPKSFHPSITYGLTGDLVIGLSEYSVFVEDLTEVGVTGSVLLVLVVLLYYLRFRTLVAMSLTILIGVAWTFGVTQVTIGHLNMATGFLFTIVAGNGINFAIIFMARYLEARRDGIPLEQALELSQRETWIPTLTAACAAGAAYASLLVTDFRGFRDFGAIGGAGMLLCWIATFATLPSILTVIERFSPLNREETPGMWGRLRKSTERGIEFGRPFAALAGGAPRVITIVGALLALGGGALTYRYFSGDPMEYDLNNLQSKQSDRSKEEQRLIHLAEGITGYVGLNGMAIVVERPDQVAPLKAKLLERRDSAAPGLKPFEDVHALQDFVPANQAEKIPVLLALKERVLRAKKRNIINDADWGKIKDLIPPDDLKPFGLAELPDGIARLFTEKDGTRGRIVYISPTKGELTSDAKYLFRWADSFRETKLADATIYGSGRAVIYADMWASITEDVPTAVLASFLATLLVVVLAFRAGKPTAIVVVSLLIGVAWMTGGLSLGKVKLNFLNFIALPLTFGIGVDYAVNIMQRYRSDGPGSALTAVRSTGGAVVLCSLTTLLGYLALVRSKNYAVRSMGIAAVLGEATCLIAAVLVLPAALTWLDSRRKHQK